MDIHGRVIMNFFHAFISVSSHMNEQNDDLYIIALNFYGRLHQELMMTIDDLLDLVPSC